MGTMRNGLIKKWSRGEEITAWNGQFYREKSRKNSTNLEKDEPVNRSSHSDKEENIGEIPDAKEQKLHERLTQKETQMKDSYIDTKIWASDRVSDPAFIKVGCVPPHL